VGSARGLAAVLAAGAEGAWVGTAFLTCVESTSSPATMARLVEAAETDTVYGRVFDVAVRARWPREWGERALRNAYYDRWDGREDALAGDESALGEMATAREQDVGEVICVNAGQGVGLLREVTTAAAVVAELAGAEALLRAAAERAR
jgi:nitronate monooxygenase